MSELQRGGSQSVEKKHGTDFSNTAQNTVEECPSKFFFGHNSFSGEE